MAQETFTIEGLPTPKLEAWKYTNLRALGQIEFQAPLSTPSIDKVPTVSQNAIARLVFINGQLNESLSDKENLPDGVSLDTNAPSLDIGSNETVLAECGFSLNISAGVETTGPVEVIFIGGISESSVAYKPSIAIVLEENSRASVLENHMGLGDNIYFSNGVTEVSVGQNAQLNHIKIQAEGSGAYHLSNLRARVGRDGAYDACTLSIGAKLSRNDINARLEGEGATCSLNGATLLRDTQHCDNTTVVDHLVPNTACDEVFKGVLDDKSRSVFQGKIVVHKDAQKTDGRQYCRTLLLSDDAEVNAKPELEIYADDVKCAHGATVGEIDEAALFYLRSRGIPEKRARSLMVESFLGEALENIDADDISAHLLGMISNWLSDEG
jgi:Fe-S cluster assembly protein SufD